MALLFISEVTMGKASNNKYLVQLSEYRNEDPSEDCYEVLVASMSDLENDKEVLDKFRCLECDAVSGPSSRPITLLCESNPIDLPSVRNVLYRMAALQALWFFKLCDRYRLLEYDRF